MQDQHVRFELIALVNASSTSNGANVDHSIAELNKSTALAGQLSVGNILENEIHQRLVLVLPEPLNEVVASKRLAEAECGQTVFREAEIKHSGNIDSGRSKLLLLLHKIRAANLNRVRKERVGVLIGRRRTNPMAHLWRNRESNSSISGDACYNINILV